ncbi:hypothetical protein G7054_g4313 [Neopestalotiopsis clavispora]|nr:hypothetical protein G7054_g4313 [Neopestalotiopsis clavispora]
MEYMEHGDLQRRLIRPYPELEVRSIASQLLEGLQFMHENGFTHRDLKPGYPSPDWWVKISDFGISKRVDDELTSLRAMVGTRGYLAPEIIGLFPIADEPAAAEQIAKESYTSAIDIWALGEICFKLIANRPAFMTLRELFNYVVLGHDFPWATLHNANASGNCINFIQLTMAASAVDRPSAADGLMCAWMKAEAEAEKELNGQPRLNAPQADAAGVAELQDYEATAAWSTLSGSPTKTPTSSAPTWHTRNPSSLSSNLYMKGRVFEGATEVSKKHNEPNHPSSSGGRKVKGATLSMIRKRIHSPPLGDSRNLHVHENLDQYRRREPLGDSQDFPVHENLDQYRRREPLGTHPIPVNLAVTRELVHNSRVVRFTRPVKYVYLPGQRTKAGQPV